MGADEELVRRLGDLMPDARQKRMFGGVAFMRHGHMTVAAGSSGDLMVRIDPGEAEALTAQDGVERMVMNGRPMDGWLTVAPDVTATDEALTGWVELATDFVVTLQPRSD